MIRTISALLVGLVIATDTTEVCLARDDVDILSSDHVRGKTGIVWIKFAQLTNQKLPTHSSHESFSMWATPDYFLHVHVAYFFFFFSLSLFTLRGNEYKLYMGSNIIIITLIHRHYCRSSCCEWLFFIGTCWFELGKSFS